MPLVRSCGWCQATDKTLLRCSKCCLVVYCGRECQIKHWKKEHKKSCSKTETTITFNIAERKAGTTYEEVGDSSPENISMVLFLKMTTEQQEEAVIKFAQATRSIRKYTEEMKDVSLRWAAVSATARLVMMYMNIKDWGAADERLHAFFRLVKRLEEVEPSQAQRDKWGLDSYVTTMTKNHCVVEEILLQAEIFTSCKRVSQLEPGKNKSEKTYVFIQNIIRSQEGYAKLGPDYIEMNVSCRIKQIFMCVISLMDLGCTDADIENGVDLSKSFGIMENQFALAFTILDDALEDYSGREEQISKLQYLVGVVKQLKVYVEHHSAMFFFSQRF